MAPRRPALAVLVAALAASALSAVALGVFATAARADTAWGTTGATYRSGLVCPRPGGGSVALVDWDVVGSAAYAISDVTATGSSYGPAPVSGTTSPLTAGRHGVTATDIAALAYLIAHGSDRAADVAETSADVAAEFGNGPAQAACLGRDGTSAAHAAAALQRARLFAGPYTVQVANTGSAPGISAPVRVTVLSASGVPTPGIGVAVTVGGPTATAVTGADGTAIVRVTAPAATSATQVTAVATAATGLTWIASKPASVTLAAPTTYRGQGTLTTVLHPTPTVTASLGTGLVLTGGTLSPTVTVGGTAGYSGTGTVSVLGPVAVPADGSCSSASAATYAAAPTVWNAPFSFTGDGPHEAGPTGALTAGCYVVTARIATASDPAARANAAADPRTAIDVSALQLTQSVGSGLATAASLAVTVTATKPGNAQVQSTVTTYGPLPVAANGRCPTTTSVWSKAHVVAISAAVPLVAASDGALAAVVHAPPVTGLGCYAVVARSSVTVGDLRAVVTSTPGAPGTTAAVLAPSVALVDHSYDGQQGVPMTGTVQVAGTYRFPGTVSVGLVSAPATDTGCRNVTFPTSDPGTARTTLSTTGDGSYTFHSPVPTANRCYGVVATIVLTADSDVRAQASSPGSGTVFLAGAVERPAAASVKVPVGSVDSLHRARTVLAAAGGAVLVTALLLLIVAAFSRRRREPSSAELVLDLDSAATADVRGNPRELTGV